MTILRFMLIMQVCGTACKEWHGHQNHTLRDGDACAEWVMQMACGGVIEHAAKCLEPLKCREALRTAQFALSLPSAKALGDDIFFF